MTIGLALLARNNADILLRAVSPFIGLVDDIAILLGGWSTDNTAEIARTITANVDGYTGPLDESGGLLDFGKARQQSFDMLQTDWVLVIDTDDIWSGVENLQQIVSDADTDGLSGVLFPYDLGGSRFLQTRLFRRNSGRWSSPVHEQWIYNDKATKVLTTNLMTVRQEKDPALKMASVDRNLRIAERYLVNNLDFRLLMHASREYLIARRYDDAIRTADKFLVNLDRASDNEKTPDKLFQVHFVRGMAYLCLEDYEAAAGATLTALSHANYGHGWALLAEISHQIGAHYQVLYACDMAMSTGRPLDTLPTPYANVSYVPLHLKAKALAALNRKHEAIIALDLGLALKSDCKEIQNLKFELCNELGVIP